jgi:hypothetical protein
MKMMVILEPWENIFLSLVHGFLIGGIILFLFSLFVNLGHGGDHDGEVDADSGIEIEAHGDIDAGVDIDVDVEVDVDTGLDMSIEADHDIDHSSGHENHSADVHSTTGTSPAPFLLLLSSFMLTFGIMGEIIYSIALNPLIRILLLFFFPIFVTKGISYTWKKLAVESSYEIPSIKIDNQVLTLTAVDEAGGLVLADTTDINRPKEKLHFLGKIKMQAKTIPGNKPITKGKIGYVIDIDEKNTLIIDEWPTPPHKNKIS